MCLNVKEYPPHSPSPFPDCASGRTLRNHLVKPRFAMNSIIESVMVCVFPC